MVCTSKNHINRLMLVTKINGLKGVGLLILSIIEFTIVFLLKNQHYFEQTLYTLQNIQQKKEKMLCMVVFTLEFEIRKNVAVCLILGFDEAI